MAFNLTTRARWGSLSGQFQTGANAGALVNPNQGLAVQIQAGTDGLEINALQASIISTNSAITPFLVRLLILNGQVPSDVSAFQTYSNALGEPVNNALNIPGLVLWEQILQVAAIGNGFMTPNPVIDENWIHGVGVGPGEFLSVLFFPCLDLSSTYALTWYGALNVGGRNTVLQQGAGAQQSFSGRAMTRESF